MTRSPAPLVPIMIGPANVEAALGLTWREALALAKRLGVRVVESGERRVISARELLAAIERDARPVAIAEPTGEALVLARLGRRAAP